MATLGGHQHLASAAHVSDGLADQGLGNLQGGLPQPLEVLRPGLLALVAPRLLHLPHAAVDLRPQESSRRHSGQGFSWGTLEGDNLGAHPWRLRQGETLDQEPGQGALVAAQAVDNLRRGMSINIPLLCQAQLFFSELQAHHTHQQHSELEQTGWDDDTVARSGQKARGEM